MSLPESISPEPYWVCIPARRHSTRLPNKPLADIAGLPMVLRTAQAAQASGAARVLVATDDLEIHSVVAAAGVEVVLTRADHPSGTDRLAEVVEQLRAEDRQLIVNLQGDEPLMPPAVLNALAEQLARHPDHSVATAVTPIRDTEELLSPSVVKAVLRSDGTALYFSRAPVPWQRDAWANTGPSLALAQQGQQPLRHLGLYAFRAGALRAYQHWQPTALEQSEQLEQLRWMDHGHAITAMVLAEAPPPGVDTPEDLARVRATLATAASQTN